MGHWYKSKSGLELPSVTTILEATMPLENRAALDKWLSKGLSSYLHTEAAKQRGNNIDAWAKAYLMGTPLPLVDSRYFSHIRHLRNQLSPFKHLDQVSADVELISDSLGFAGTADLILDCPEYGLTVLDFKTRDYCSPVALERAFIQCAGYAQLIEDLMTPLVVETLAVFTITPTRCIIDRVTGENKAKFSAIWNQRKRDYGVCSQTGFQA